MNFDFTAEQFQLRDTVRAFLDDHWGSQQIRASFAGSGVPDGMWQALTELGLTTLLVPEAYGGLGLSLTDASLIFEAFGETLAPGLAAEVMLATDVIARFGTAGQQAELLPAIAEGRLKPVMAMQDSATSYDPQAITTVATRAGNGWRLSGHKQTVPYAHLADRLLVCARVEGGASLAFFLCDPQVGGVSVTPHVLVDPSYRMSSVRFEDVACPPEAMLGGDAAVTYGRLAAAAAASAQLSGAAGRALAMTLDYAKQRRQFGRAIGSFQAIKHKLADMMVTYETSRSAAYYAHWALAQDDPGAAAAVSLAKAYAGDMARAVLNESVHIHGGIGFTWEYDLHLFLKRGKVLEYAHGDASWHREQYARAVIG
jgi:acyl-CoA dehydrogenase